ncbi:MAG TPA: hypothetical protein VNI02_04925 [Blastocatellia bacterium]|jgi:hypothetical protein|nr:hypothetical protein [Blastocatellia bacterium]
MKSRFSLPKAGALILLPVALFAASCATDVTSTNRNAGNANSANSNKAAASSSGTPADATPMGQTAPGYFQAGPTGNASLRFTAPQDGAAIEGNSVAPTFTVAGYPIYKDAERNKGQHIHVILDNEPYEADYDPAKPFSPENGKFNNLSPGTHTLRAFPGREWHESIKQNEGAFDMVVFNVGKPTVTNIDKRAPLLTYSRPKGENRFKDDPRGLLLDFYVSNANIGINDYKVKYTLNGKDSRILTSWQPVWWKWEELGPGDYTILLELLDKDNKPVPFKVGNMDYNRTERKFKILHEGEQPGAADHGHSANSNASGGGNRNGAAANANRR